MDSHNFIERIRPLIGSHFDYLGHNWVLIEVLEDEAQLVLSDPTSHAIIQGNLYGQASRRVAETLMVPLFKDTPDSLSDELIELLAHRIHDI